MKVVCSPNVRASLAVKAIGRGGMSPEEGLLWTLFPGPQFEDGAILDLSRGPDDDPDDRDPTTRIKCSVEGCNEPFRAKGMCKKHYNTAYYREYRNIGKAQRAA